MQAAMSLARDCWQSQYTDAVKAEEDKKREELAQRKKSEVLYRIAPDLEPELIDERLRFGGTPRSEGELDWVEARLTSLGFQITWDGNAKSYTHDMGFCGICGSAQSGRVDFSVFPKDTSDREAAYGSAGHPSTYLMVGRRSFERSTRCVSEMPFHN